MGLIALQSRRDASDGPPSQTWATVIGRRS
jgi:hypothetical protein